MASGSTAPFSGDHADLENVQEEQHQTKGMTESEREVLNDQIVGVARNQFEHNLNELSYDGGLFTIYRDQSKIASSSNAIISTFDSGGTGRTKIAKEKEIYQNDGSSGTITATSDQLDVEIIVSKAFITGIGVLDFSGSSNDVTIDIEDGGGTTIASVSITLSGNEGRLVNIPISEYSRPLSNETVTVKINASDDLLVVDNRPDSFSGNFFNLNSQDPPIQQNTAGKDSIRVEGSLKSSATITSVSKDLSKADNGGLSSPPSSAVLSQSADIPTDTDISYTLRDGNGNTATVTQSDVDSVVDTSNFTSTTVEVEVNLSQSRTNDDKTPTSKDVMVHFKE